MNGDGYEAVFFDLFGTLVDDTATAIYGASDRIREAAETAHWAVVTSTSRAMALSLLATAGLPAPAVLVSADDVLRNKPAPDGYLLAAHHVGVEPERALVVEDSLQGIAAAREAGMDVVAILRGRAPGFARAATYVVKDIASLRLRVNGGVATVEVESPRTGGTFY
jgi:sugar-phosphatase